MKGYIVVAVVDALTKDFLFLRNFGTVLASKQGRNQFLCGVCLAVFCQCLWSGGFKTGIIKTDKRSVVMYGRSHAI
ncbi:unnamed protein product [Urochloa humidicola]